MGDLSWSLLRNVKEDVRNLLKSFQSTGSLRFSDFSKVWRDKKFSLIFRGRLNFAEVLEFCEEIIHITKEYLLPAHEFPIRVGALYALYGLYFKQPLKEPAKIRLIKSEWENLCEVIEQCKRENHVDAVFIHLKLFIKQAYIFTATERPMGLEIGYRKYYNQKNITLSGSSRLDDTNENPLIEPGVLDELSKMVSLYCKTKSGAAGNADPQLIDDNFAKYLKEQCQVHESEKQNVKEDNNGDKILGDVNSDEEQRPDLELEGKPSKNSIGARRTKLKEKGFTSKKKKPIEAESAKDDGDGSLPKKPKVPKHLKIARKKAQVLIKQREMDFNLEPQPSHSRAPDFNNGLENQEDNLTLPQL